MANKDKGGALLIRRTPNHCLVAMLQQCDEGLKLVRIIPDLGYVPYVADLQDTYFENKKEVRNVIKDRMRIRPEVFFEEHMQISTVEQLNIEAYFLQLHGDLAEDAVMCAQYIDSQMWVYLLGMSPTDGYVVNDYVVSVPTYNDQGIRETDRNLWHFTFNGSYVK